MNENKKYEDMTMDEFLTLKASMVEESIRNHCKDMCDLIMKQYEDARSRELNLFENSANPTRTDMIVTLKVTAGAHEGQIFVVKPRSKHHIIVGRSINGDIIKEGVSLPKDHEVSSYHGKFFIRNGQLKYKDTNSTNHSYVNTIMVDTETTIKEGDVLRIGQTVMAISIN